MTFNDKELWLTQHGSIVSYGITSYVAPSTHWTAVGKRHTVTVHGTGTDAIIRLYASVSNALYSIAVKIEGE